MNKKVIYLHEFQMKFYGIIRRVKVLIAGRGWGKTTIQGLTSYTFMSEMPRSRGAMVGLTYNQLITKVLPPMFSYWEGMGFKEYDEETKTGHFIFGKKPPSHWDAPRQNVKRYNNVLSWWNGSIIELLSMDRPNLNLGGNFDWMMVDEVQNIDETKFNKDYVIALRGSHPIFKKSPYFRTLIMTGTMPWTQAGQWIFKYEEYAKQDPDNYLFMQRTSYDNIAILGEDYFVQLEKQIGAMMFAVEIKNQKVNIISDGFYPEFSEKKHCYFNAYEYEGETDISSLSSYKVSLKDYNPSKPLSISFDFGAKITTLLIAQQDEQTRELRFINMMYETSETLALATEIGEASNRPLQRVVQRFIQNYGTHKEIIEIYGDHTGHNRSDRSDTSYDTVEAMLRKAGLRYINKSEKTTNPKHNFKYQVINQTFTEDNPIAWKVRINENTCKPLILSIQISPVLNDFQKDKRSERKELPPEMQTHFSDALDYIVMSKNGEYYRDGGMIEASISFS